MSSRTRFHEVAQDVYAVLGSNGMPNAVCVDGGAAGVVVIDSRFTPAYAAEMIAEVRSVSEGSVVALVNTHFHCDHTFGNGEVPTDRIIAHEQTSAKLKELGDAYVELIRKNRPDLAEELAGVTLRLPTETIRDTLELRVGDITLEIEHPGRAAHTEGDLLIRIPERGVLVAADLIFNEIAPVMRDGDIFGLRATLAELRDTRAEVVIPGHGEVGGPELIPAQIRYIDTVTEATERVLSQGGDVEAAEQAALERLGALLFAEQRVGESVGQVAAKVQG